MSTSEMIGIPKGTEHGITGRWEMTDWARVTGSRKSLDAAEFSAKLNIFNDGTRTVALVTTGYSSDLRNWRMVESDDPAVATFIEELIAASQDS